MEEKNNRKRGGKKAEPSRQELECYAEWFLRGFTNKDVLDEIEDNEFPKRTVGFIKRRRKEFECYQKIIEEKGKIVSDPVIINRRRGHWDKLADMAGAMLSYWNRYIEERVDYKHYYSSRRYVASEEEMKEIDCFIASSLLDHMKAEFPDELSNVGDGTDLLRTDCNFCYQLALLAYRKTFKGSCTICKEWVIR